MAVRTITALKRWSYLDKDLPAIPQIKSLHVYDFDNTLFKTPVPNQQLWTGPTVGHMSKVDGFVNGGWWHDARILAATGKGVEEEEPRQWEGWWNEEVVSLVKLSMKQKDALNVLLTGRSENDFADLIRKIVNSKGLEFDMVCLKPEAGPSNQRFASTMAFKQALLEDMLYTYTEAEDIRIYEDRTKHVTGFRQFFERLNRSLTTLGDQASRKPFAGEVVVVSETATTLDPVIEIQEVQRMINDHNAAVDQGAPSQYGRQSIIRSTLYTGYMLSQAATESLISLVRIPSRVPENEIRYLANSILIAPRPCAKSMLGKVGGIGHKVRWRVTGVGVHDDKIWGATVKPVPETTKILTENRPPTIVLAHRKGVRPMEVTNIRNWELLPEEEAFEFDTVIGEKVLLQIDEERPPRGRGWQRAPPNRFNNKRRYMEEMDIDSYPPSALPEPEKYPQLEAPADHNGHEGRHNNGSATQLRHQLPSKPVDTFRNENFPPQHYHHRYQQHHHGSNRGRGGGSGGGYRGSRGGGGSHRGARGDRGGRGRHRGGGGGGGGGGPSYVYRSLDDAPYERSHTGNAGGAAGPFHFGLDGANDFRRDSDGGDDGGDAGGGVSFRYGADNGGGDGDLPYS